MYIVPAPKKGAALRQKDEEKKKEFGGSLVNKEKKSALALWPSARPASGVANEPDNCYYQMLSDLLQIIVVELSFFSVSVPAGGESIFYDVLWR